jgi:polar amino acid transport system substrate-binding protein
MRFARGVVFWWLLVLCCGRVFAGEAIILATGEWPPFVSGGMAGQGFATEIVVAAARVAGYEPAIEIVPWARAEHLAKEGLVTGTFVWAKNDERSQYFLFTEPFSYTREKIFYLKKRFPQLSYAGLTSLRGYTFGGTISYGHVAILERAGLEVEVAQSDEINLRKLEAGRFDFFAMDEIAAWHAIANLFPGREHEFGCLEEESLQAPMGLMVSKSRPNVAEFITRFNQGLESIRSTGVYDEILSRHKIPRQSQQH